MTQEGWDKAAAGGGAMQVRMGYALELVGVIAAGMALARWAYFAVDPLDSDLIVYDPFIDGFILGSVFLHGVTLAGVVGLGIEAARGRSPRPWGIGRRAWSLAGWLFLLETGGTLLKSSGLLRSSSSGRELGSYLVHVLKPIAENPTIAPACLMAAVWVTSWMAGLPGGTPRDARECAGRALMAAILAHGIALQVFQTVRYW